jgi:hypothetical protein
VRHEARALLLPPPPGFELRGAEREAAEEAEAEAADADSREGDTGAGAGEGGDGQSAKQKAARAKAAARSRKVRERADAKAAAAPVHEAVAKVYVRARRLFADASREALLSGDVLPAWASIRSDDSSEAGIAGR